MAVVPYQLLMIEGAVEGMDELWAPLSLAIALRVIAAWVLKR